MPAARNDSLNQYRARNDRSPRPPDFVSPQKRTKKTRDWQRAVGTVCAYGRSLRSYAPTVRALLRPYVHTVTHDSIYSIYSFIHAWFDTFDSIYSVIIYSVTFFLAFSVTFFSRNIPPAQHCQFLREHQITQHIIQIHTTSLE